jgi:hypothetical protein
MPRNARANVVVLETAMHPPILSLVTKDERDAHECRTVESITTMIDRWCYIHRLDIRDPAFKTEAQRHKELKRRVLKRLRETL